VEKPSVIPLESLHSRKEDVGRTLRFTAREARRHPRSVSFGAPGKGGSRDLRSAPQACRDLGQAGKVNDPDCGRPAAAPIEKLLHEQYALEDLGLTLRRLDAGRGTSLESPVIF
jgi:hypothetical protein